MAETLSCGVVEVARVGAVAGQLPCEWVVVDHELVGVQLVAGPVVAGYAAGNRQLRLDAAGSPYRDGVADPHLSAVDLDRTRADGDHATLLADPRQLGDPFEENELECPALRAVPPGVDVTDDRPPGAPLA